VHLGGWAVQILLESSFLITVVMTERRIFGG
jgi:hypothetical protein